MKAVTLKVPSIPGDAAAPKLNVEIRPINGSETLRECLALFRDARKVKESCAFNDGEQHNTVLRNLLQGPALQAYDSALSKALAKEWKDKRTLALNVEARNRRLASSAAMSNDEILVIRNGVNKPDITEEMISAGVQAVIRYMAPTKALAKQHAWMRRHCRKPSDMTTKVFLNHLMRINDEELPYIPPKFNTSQKLTHDDIIDIVLHGIPRRWAREFERTGFDPMEQTLEALMEQCERMESLDFMDGERTTKKTDTWDPKKNPKKSHNHKKHKASHEKRSGDCVIHGKGCGHSTDECKVVLGMVDPDKKKVSFKKDSKNHHTNKSWS
ncbi:MAG: hypothetical protein ACRCT2_00250, partial [Plesiomonas shigelloides]